MANSSTTTFKRNPSRRQRNAAVLCADKQLDLFSAVVSVYAGADRPLNNDELYDGLIKSGAIEAESITARMPIGESGALHSKGKRTCRWVQQTLKQMDILQHTGNRGEWQLHPRYKEQLTPAPDDISLVAFSTDLGVAIWGRCENVFDGLAEEVTLVLSSPPYCLQNPRNYGNPPESEYIDFICRSLEPLVKRLALGGSICLVLGHDIFQPNSPARSMYAMRLMLTLNERFGLELMDTIPWVNYSRPPGPIAWASKQRVQLNGTYEPIYWLTNSPRDVRSDNRRVLQPHTEKQLKLMQAGGEKRTASYGDGANIIRPGSYGKETPGRIPRNVITAGHNCASTRELRTIAKAMDLPCHSATHPLSIYRFLIEFLTRPGDLVVDPFGGWMKVPAAAEALGRRWLASELMREHLMVAKELFRKAAGYREREVMSLA